MRFILVTCLLCSSVFAGDVPPPPSTVVLKTDANTRWNCQTGILRSSDKDWVQTCSGDLIFSDTFPFTTWLIKYDLPPKPPGPCYVSYAAVDLRFANAKQTEVRTIANNWTVKSYRGVFGNSYSRSQDTLGRTAIITPPDGGGMIFRCTDDVQKFYDGTWTNNGWIGLTNTNGRSEVYCENSAMPPQITLNFKYEQADPDFDGDNQYTVNDMNGLMMSYGEDYNPHADLNYDGEVDDLDRDIMLGTVLETVLFDLNDDNVFDSSDLVILFQGGKYETGQPALYVEGDATGDGLFTSDDIVAAFMIGHYQGGAAAMAADWLQISGQ